MNENEKNKSLSMDEWRSMAAEGIDVPVTIQLSGYSMQPLIRYKRDYVTVVPIRRDIKIGDIVVFVKPDGVYCAHRVAQIKNNKVLTLGDNCFYHDPWMTEDKLIGLIVSMERNGKNINLDCRTARAYGKLHMALLPVRKFKKNLIQFLWKRYLKIFKNK